LRALGRKCPEGEFYKADLHEVRLPDGSVDLVVCAIALSHVADLGPALAELVRVLRPNGHLVISDSRGLIGDIGLLLVRIGPGGEFGYMPIWSRLASDYLAAALPPPRRRTRPGGKACRDHLGLPALRGLGLRRDPDGYQLEVFWDKRAAAGAPAEPSLAAARDRVAS
jgi:SAM-dependent methyltransferase